MRKVVFMIDGWFMRKRIYSTKAFFYTGATIRDYCRKHLRNNDSIYRIFYYDTEPMDRKGHNPVSNKAIDFGKTATAIQQKELLNSLKTTPNFALRLGKTIWRDKQWILAPDKLKALLSKKITIEQIKESDLKPRIEQKTVDMKIGIDIALVTLKKLADVLIIITGDMDIVPALKEARREGMLVGLDPLGNPINDHLSEHVDFVQSYIGEYIKKGKNKQF